MSRVQPSPVDLALWLQVSQFLYRYADHLDHERFTDWVALFDTEDCRYEVLSRENRDLGLSLPIMGCFSHGMVQDRVAMLAKGVLTYRRDRLLRQVSNVQIVPGSSATLTTFAVTPAVRMESTKTFGGLALPPG